MVGMVQVEYSSILSRTTIKEAHYLSKLSFFYCGKAIKMRGFKVTVGRKCICLVDLPKMYFKVQDVWPAKEQYQVSTVTPWDWFLEKSMGKS
jgi:hypothetical protein